MEEQKDRVQIDIPPRRVRVDMNAELKFIVQMLATC